MQNAFASEEHTHGGEIYHAFKLETSLGHSTSGDDLQEWDFDGWIGTDEDKLWLKSEGERVKGEFESSEFWALYSRNVSDFWDAQIGIRYDDQPNPVGYAVMGVNGLAPYFFETQAHLFVSEEGDVLARLRQENEFLITQILILEPFLELNFSANDIPDQEIGAGLTTGEIGLQTRYEITRAFAPYLEIKHERKFGETSSIAKSHGENNHATIGSVGVRFLF